MIETPAAAIMADRLAEVCDFFSVGTNDLVQYTMAADRQNSSVSYLCDGAPPPLLRILSYVGECAKNGGIWAGICGELASDINLTETFLRMGVDELSVSPGRLLAVRKRIREIDLREKFQKQY